MYSQEIQCIVELSSPLRICRGCSDNMERFGFLIHPISVRKDVARKYPFAQLPAGILGGATAHASSHPKRCRISPASARLTGSEAEGWFVGCPLTPRQFMELDAALRHRQNHRRSEDCPAGGREDRRAGGLYLHRRRRRHHRRAQVDIAVTTGNSYTCYTAIEGAQRAAALMGVEPAQARVAIVGATGSIGRVCAHLLAEQGVGETGAARARYARACKRWPANCPPAPTVRVSTDLDADLPTGGYHRHRHLGGRCGHRAAPPETRGGGLRCRPPARCLRARSARA